MKENIYNIPNSATLLRLILSFFVVIAALFKVNRTVIVVAIAIGLLSDFVDGRVARKLHQVTKFGAKFDIVADRFMGVGTVIAIVLIAQTISSNQIIQLFLIMTREIITSPFALYNLIRGKVLHAKNIGKLTSLVQGIALGLTGISIIYVVIPFSLYTAFVASIIGIFAAVQYVKDTLSTS